MEENKVTLQIKPEVASGKYSNLALISHSRAEFIVDFAVNLPGGNPEVVSRIVLTPEHAKRLLGALQDNIIKYEAQFGDIEIEQQPRKGGTFNLGDLGNLGGNGPKQN